MNEFYDEDFLLEGKKSKDDDNEDDGLLNKIKYREKKENPLYTDYKNAQIMSGKVVKSEKGWKQEEKRKSRIKKVLGTAAVVGTGLAVHHGYKMHNDPVAREKNRQRKATNAQIDQYGKQNKKEQKKAGREQAKIDAKIQRIDRRKTQKDEINKRLAAAGKKTTGFGGWWNRTFSENIEFLLENYTLEQLSEYLVMTESKDDKAALYEKYQKYVDKCLEKGQQPMTFKEYKERKKTINKRLKRAITATTLVGAGVANHMSVKKTGKSIPERIKFTRRNNQTRKYTNKYENDMENINKIRNLNATNYRSYNENLYELNDFSNDEIQSYLENYNDPEFSRRSYHSYCVMMESRGLKPVDESVFSDMKEKITEYSQAAIKGIKEEKKKKEAKLEELKKKEAEEEKKRKAREKEMLAKMSPEDRKEYLTKKAKEEEEKEQRKKEKHELTHTFKKGFMSGSGEQLGKAAAKTATRFILR